MRKLFIEPEAKKIQFESSISTLSSLDSNIGLDNESNQGINDLLGEE